MLFFEKLNLVTFKAPYSRFDDEVAKMLVDYFQKNKSLTDVQLDCKKKKKNFLLH